LEELVKDLLRTLVAAIVGAVVALAVVLGQPALAGQVDKAKAKKVTSAAIKDGTIKKKDLNAEVTGPLAKADSALQGIPDNSVSSGKLTDNAVTAPKIANDAVTAPKIADDAVTAPKIADDAVTTPKLAHDAVTGAELADDAVTGPNVADNAIGATEVTDHALRIADIATASGTISIDFPPLGLHGCVSQVDIVTGTNVTGDLLLVSQPANVVGAVTIQIRENSSNANDVDIVACNVAASSVVDPPSTTYRWAVISN
jgi:hypothetical protein